MADAGLTLVVVPPGFDGLSEAVRSIIRDDSIVTAYEDSRLHLFDIINEGDEEVEIVPIGEVLGRVLRMMGQAVYRIPTFGQRQAMAALACQSLPSTSPMERSAKFPGMARLISDNLDNLRHFGVESEQLTIVSERAPESTSAKLQTLAEIADLIRDSMDVIHREFLSDQVWKCLNSDLNDSPLKHLVVLAGPRENPIMEKFLNWLAEHGVEVHVLLELVPERTDLFLPAQKAASRLKTKKRSVFGSVSWCDNLFTNRVSKSHPETEIVCCSDPMSEAEWVLRRCQDFVIQGIPAEKIGIFTGDHELYMPRLAAAAKQFDLELDASRTVPLMSCGLSIITVQLLRALMSSDVRHLAQLTKSSYCPTTLDMQKEIWEAVSQITREGGDKWNKFSEWAKTSDTCPQWLIQVLTWREEKSLGTATLSAWLNRFREFIGEVVVQGATIGSHDETQERDLRAQTVLQRSLADTSFVYDQAGLGELSLGGFIAMAERLWEDETITLGGNRRGFKVFTDVLALGDVDVLIVLGMLEGSIPHRRREDSLLMDSELALISKQIGLDIPDSHDSVRAERDRFYRLCMGGKKSLVFTYPLAGDEHSNVPAFYLEELERCIGGEVRKVIHGRDEVVPFPDECFFETDRSLRQQIDSNSGAEVSKALASSYAKEMVIPDFEAGLTTEELSLVLTCPFQSAYRYRLQVPVPSRSIGIGVLKNIPRRAYLADIATKSEAHKRLRDELERTLEFLIPSLEEWEVELLRASGERLCQEWADKEFESRRLWPREPGSVYSNVQFGERGLKNDFSFGGKAVKIKGSLAAIYFVGKLSVIQLYRSSEPKLEATEQGIANDPKLFEIGFLMHSQMQRSIDAVAVEIDSLNGPRSLIHLSHGILPSGSSAMKVSPKHFSMTNRELTGAVRSRAKDAINLLDQGLATIIPGAHCNKCLYGEICRKSESKDP